MPLEKRQVRRSKKKEGIETQRTKSLRLTRAFNALIVDVDKEQRKMTFQVKNLMIGHVLDGGLFI